MLAASLWLALVVALPGALAWSISAVAMALVVGPAAGVRVRPGRWSATASCTSVAPGSAPSTSARRPRSTRTPPAGWPGVDADARAYLLLRPYLKRAVRVEITDPADPTPYWLVSTRHPDRLAAAVTDPHPLGGGGLRAHVLGSGHGQGQGQGQLEGVVAAVAGVGARRRRGGEEGAQGSWKAATGKNPPANPADPDVDVWRPWPGRRSAAP